MLSSGACHIPHNHEIETVKNLVPALKPSVQPSVHGQIGCHQPGWKAVQFCSLLNFC